MAEWEKPEADGPSDYSWGPGLDPPHLKGKPPSEGGRYRGKAPDGHNYEDDE
jgi:hypothetical protein